MSLHKVLNMLYMLQGLLTLALWHMTDCIIIWSWL